MSPQPETRPFQAEARQLLDLMIHSLYTQKEIFLRELVSNASDALDRLRFEALTDPELLSGDETLEIHIEVDREARTLTIRDNGVGMNRDEVIANIGTIARSGSRELMETIRESQSRRVTVDGGRRRADRSVRRRLLFIVHGGGAGGARHAAGRRVGRESAGSPTAPANTR